MKNNKRPDDWPRHVSEEDEPMLVILGLEPGCMDYIFDASTLARLNAYRKRRPVFEGYRSANERRIAGRTPCS
jgi:hypothetical protein